MTSRSGAFTAFGSLPASTLQHKNHHHQEQEQVHQVRKPDLEGWTGGAIWESGQVLARLLSAEPERVWGKGILELGCGCGLVGLTAGALGARQVTLADQVLFIKEWQWQAPWR